MVNKQLNRFIEMRTNKTSECVKQSEHKLSGFWHAHGISKLNWCNNGQFSWTSTNHQYALSLVSVCAAFLKSVNSLSITDEALHAWIPSFARSLSSIYPSNFMVIFHSVSFIYGCKIEPPLDIHLTNVHALSVCAAGPMMSLHGFYYSAFSIAIHLVRYVCVCVCVLCLFLKVLMQTPVKWNEIK